MKQHSSKIIHVRTWSKDWNTFFDPAKFYRFTMVFIKTRSLFTISNKKIFPTPIPLFPFVSASSFSKFLYPFYRIKSFNKMDRKKSNMIQKKLLKEKKLSISFGPKTLLFKSQITQKYPSNPFAKRNKRRSSESFPLNERKIDPNLYQ